MMTMDAVILCGGLGTRLRTAIGERQKVMAGFDGRPFLDIVLDYLAGQGIRRVILAAGYQAQEIAAYAATAPFGLTLVLSSEPEPLGTGGALKNAADKIVSDEVFVLNGDSFCPLDYAALAAAHERNGAWATVALSRVEDARDYGTVELDAQSRVTAFREKNAASGAAYVNAGVYLLSRAALAALPSGKSSLERDVFPQWVLRPQKDFYGFPVAAPFLDIGTPQRYEEAKAFLRKGRS